MERTFLMLKPDAVQRGLMGDIVQRFEKKGLKMVACKFMMVSKELAEKHYYEHVNGAYYPDLIRFVTSAPVLAMVWEGDQAIALARHLIGKTNLLESTVGTIRGDYSLHANRNLIHGSDSVENAEREWRNFFAESELVSYTKAVDTWL